jgi:hypothetical protein
MNIRCAEQRGQTESLTVLTIEQAKQATGGTSAPAPMARGLSHLFYKPDVPPKD